VTLDPRCLALVGDERPHGALELHLGLCDVVGLEDPGLRLDDLAERPERDSLAVREGSALAPGDEVRAALDVAEKRPDEPALADSGHAHERDELRRALFLHALQGFGQHGSLSLPADERCRADLADVHAVT
jgi:hypothetical protein